MECLKRDKDEMERILKKVHEELETISKNSESTRKVFEEARSTVLKEEISRIVFSKFGISWEKS